MVAIQTSIQTIEKPAEKNVLQRAAGVVTCVGKTALNNLFTLQSDRLPVVEQIIDLEPIEVRMERYLSAPKNADGSEPDPMAPEYRLFD